MTRTDMPKKDYLAEMKRCTHPKCRKLKDLSEFNKFGERLHSWCKACQNKNTAERQQKKREEKLAEEKIEKIKQTILRKEILSLPYFEYGDGYTKIRIDPNGNKYIVLISSKYEHLSKEIPADRAELLRDWLNVKLKQEKKL